MPRRWHPDRPWWRQALAFLIGPCWHLTHRQDECDATYQRVWSDDDLPAAERTGTPRSWDSHARRANRW